MNEESQKETEAIRSDIDVTRRRMDETIDSLGTRLQGRHLVDEILGFFRRRKSEGDSAGPGVGEKIKQSADTALHSTIDTIKAHPLPILAIGAGVAWLIYESRKKPSADYADVEFDTEYDYNQQLTLRGDVQYDPDQHYDRPLEYPSGGSGKLEGVKDKASEKFQGAKDAIAGKASAAKEKLSQVGEQARGKMQAVRARAGELGTRAKERTREAYSRSRERVVTIADQHPLEVGLGCLAAGLIAGLLLPTPQGVNRLAGGRMDRLRDRTREASREFVEKGKRVAQAASQAVQQEVQAQGLTFDRLREKAGAVADRAKEAATDTARQEGIPTPGGNSAGSREAESGNLSGSASGSPSGARPVM